MVLIISFVEAGKQVKKVTDQKLVTNIRYFCEESKIYRAEMKLSSSDDYLFEYDFDNVPSVKRIREERKNLDENDNELKSIEKAFTKIS